MNFCAENEDDFEQADSFPSMLIAKGCELNTVDASGESLLHVCARTKLEHASIFLVNKQANINMLNDECETVLHLACANGMANLVEVLLRRGADCNVQTSIKLSAQTPMHKLVVHGHQRLLDLFIAHKGTGYTHTYRSALISRPVYQPIFLRHKVSENVSFIGSV